MVMDTMRRVDVSLDLTCKGCSYAQHSQSASGRMKWMVAHVTCEFSGTSSAGSFEIIFPGNYYVQ